MSPKVKMCNEFNDFLPLDVLHGILGEDRESENQSSKKENRANADK